MIRENHLKQASLTILILEIRLLFCALIKYFGDNAKVVLNVKPDAVKSIKEYKIDANGKRELVQVVV